MRGWHRAYIMEVVLSDEAEIDKETGRPKFLTNRVEEAREAAMEARPRTRRERFLAAGIPEDKVDAVIAEKLAKLQALYDQAGVKLKAI